MRGFFTHCSLVAVSLAALTSTSLAYADTDSSTVSPDGLRFRPGKGLAATSADGDFGLALRVRGQVRYSSRITTADHQLRIRRARVVFAGHFFGRQNRFKMELAVSPNDLGVSDNLSEDLGDRLVTRSPMLDLYFDFRLLRDLEIRAGQYKLPSNRTRVISSGDLQLVDRSIVNAEFTLDRDIALDLRSRDLFGLGWLRYYLGASFGRGRDSQGFDDLGLNYFARLEALPFGFFDDYKESDLTRTARPRLSVALGYVFQDRSRGLRRIVSTPPEDGGTVTQHVGYLDALFKHTGLSLLLECAIRAGTRNPGGAVDDGGMPLVTTPPRSGWGVSLQAGYLLGAIPLEFAGRFSAVRPLENADATSLRASNEVGAGVSWYIAGHPYKVQLDGIRTFGEAIPEGATLVRLQLQAGL